ncbi:NAD-dependent epimerase/dehydratase family protein [Acidovorax soli]|uniref:NAD-dependent epimerase/dehydratase family protein n=3 Tax=Pseudomonadota TaxID=1224 RepID=UPI0032B279C3
MTGYVGAATVARLLDAGLRVRLLVRNPARLAVHATHARHPSLSVVHAPQADAAALRELFGGAQVCVHGAALADPAWVAADPARAEAANVALTEAVVSAMRESAGPDATMLLLSSLSVYGGARSQPCDAHTSPQPNTDYGWQKLAGERMVLDGLPRAHVLRPGTCVGSLPESAAAYRGDLYFNRVLAEAARQWLGRSAAPWRSRGARQVRPYVHVADVGRALAACCQRLVAGQALPGPVLNLVSPQGNLDKWTICRLAAEVLPGFQAELDDEPDADDPRDCRVINEMASWGLRCEQPAPERWARELAAFHLALEQRR